MPDSTAPQLPTIGRRCYFYPTGRFAGNVYDYRQPLDAGVVYVHPDGAVNLSVADHAGQIHAIQRVPFGDFDRVKSDAEFDAIATSRGYADWMPYQKGASHTAAPIAA